MLENFSFYLIYKLICQKQSHFSSAKMAVLSSFFEVFVTLGMYNFGENHKTRVINFQDLPLQIDISYLFHNS